MTNPTAESGIKFDIALTALNVEAYAVLTALNDYRKKRDRTETEETGTEETGTRAHLSTADTHTH